MKLEEQVRLLSPVYNEWVINDIFGSDRPNRFITLIARKGVSKNDLIDGYRKFHNILNRKLYGRHNRSRKLKHFPVVEENVGGHNHIHTILSFPKREDTRISALRCRVSYRDEVSNICKEIWEGKIRIASNVAHQGHRWNEEIYDEVGCVGYVLKHAHRPDKCEVLADLLL